MKCLCGAVAVQVEQSEYFFLARVFDSWQINAVLLTSTKNCNVGISLDLYEAVSIKRGMTTYTRVTHYVLQSGFSTTLTTSLSTPDCRKYPPQRVHIRPSSQTSCL